MKNVPQDIKQLEERLNKLQVQDAYSQQNAPDKGFVYATKTGFRVGVELLSGIVVGGAIGYFLDMFLDTRPWLMVVFLFNIVKCTNK